ncbi:MAG: FtsQ-type POTRA domain-containing protein [Bacillota bacterium]|nr:FtsQ-type POTRA domain-containing protein [Bacillota bacterium]
MSDTNDKKELLRQRRRREALQRKKQREAEEIGSQLSSESTPKKSSHQKSTEGKGTQKSMPKSAEKSASQRNSYQRSEYQSADLRSTERNVQRRRKKSRHRKQKRRLRGFARTLLWLATIACLMLIAVRTPICDIKAIKVSGNSLVSTENILAAAGVKKGDNLFSDSKADIKSRVCSLPYIESVKVKRQLPSTITITVTEGDAVAYVELEKRIAAISSSGKSIYLKKDNKFDLPVYKGLKDNGFKIGEKVGTKEDVKFDTMLKFMGYFVKYGMKNVTSLDISDTKDIVFVLGKTLTVKFGPDENIAYKMAYIKEVLSNLPQNIRGVLDATDVESGITYRTVPEEKTTKKTTKTEEPKGTAPENTGTGAPAQGTEAGETQAQGAAAENTLPSQGANTAEGTETAEETKPQEPAGSSGENTTETGAETDKPVAVQSDNVETN